MEGKGIELWLIGGKNEITMDMLKGKVIAKFSELPTALHSFFLTYWFRGA